MPSTPTICGDVLVIIFHYLPVHARLHALRTCRRWRSILSPMIYRQPDIFNEPQTARLLGPRMSDVHGATSLMNNGPAAKSAVMYVGTDLAHQRSCCTTIGPTTAKETWKLFLRTACLPPSAAGEFEDERMLARWIQAPGETQTGTSGFSKWFSNKLAIRPCLWFQRKSSSASMSSGSESVVWAGGAPTESPGVFIQQLMLSRGSQIVTDAALRALLPRCPNLIRVDLKGCAWVDEGAVIALATHCPQLRAVNLSMCVLITEDAVLRLVKGCAQLRSVSLAGCDEAVTDALLQTMALCTGKLRYLRLAQCRLFGDAGLCALAESARVSAGLRWLDVGQCPRVSRAGITAIASHCSSLEWLDVSAATMDPSVIAPNGQLTDECIAHLVESCQQLSLLNLSHRRELTDASVLSIAAHCKKLRSLTISGCTQITTDSVVNLGSDRIGWVGMSPCPAVSFERVCQTASWRVIQQREVGNFHLKLMGGRSWDDVGAKEAL